MRTLWFWRSNPGFGNGIEPLKGLLSDKLVISIIAGAEIQTISILIGGSQRIVRVMPNTPALYKQVRMVFMRSEAVNAQDRELTSQILLRQV